MKSSFTKGCAFLALATTILFAKPHVEVLADMGDMGFFGGIIDGRQLPKSTELLINGEATLGTSADFVYKEVLFMGIEPVVFEGVMEAKPGVRPSGDSGTYSASYSVGTSATSDTSNMVDRDIDFSVKYRKEDNQVIMDYTLTGWDETITIGGINYVLDEQQSHFAISIIEDQQPGATYYRGDISQRGVYTVGGGTEPYIIESTGSFYGYRTAWSTTETHRLDTTIRTPNGDIQYQVRPSVSMFKNLQYTENEPSLISFSGNYKEVMQNKSGLQYDVFIKPVEYDYIENSGSASIDSINVFEQLIAPDVSYLKGHFAEADITKLFAMQILEDDPKFFQPNQLITRGQFVSALVKAIKLPVEEDPASSLGVRGDMTMLVFPDVYPESPYYKYIMSAYKFGMAIGRDTGTFYQDSPIEREEAIAILVRTLGLENLALNDVPVTPFVDDYLIDDWARQEIYAARQMGIVSGDIDGNIRPNAYVSKAEAAAIINRLIEYMRNDLQQDYSEHIVNYAY